MRKIASMLLMLMLYSSIVLAQTRTITGKVLEKTGAPVAGASITIKGTNTGTAADSEGKFSIAAKTGDALVIRALNFIDQELVIGTESVYTISLEATTALVDEVVVTALGIKREKKSLTYASQTVDEKKLSITRANNVNDALAGKVAGIQVRGQSGAALGRNSSVRIRGVGSLTDKSPLYVVDGTPLANSDDLNPDDIESVTVLKGPSATALYGQRGDAGVILVTLKKGKKSPGLGINFNQSIFFENIYVLPKYQNSYSGGAFAELAKFTWQNGMPEEWKALDGKYYHDYTDDGSWGPRMVGQEYIPWYAWVPGTQYSGKTEKLLPHPDNIRDFYETGINRSSNLSFTKADNNYSVRVAYTNQNIQGVMPYTSLDKNTISTQASVNLGSLVTVGANINYVTQKRMGEFDDAYSNQSSGSFNQWFHRDLDMNKLKELRNLKTPEGRLVSWNHFNPQSYLALGDGFYRGYYWHNHFSYFEQINYENNRDRLFGDLNVTLNLAKNFKITGFYRKNQLTTNWENKRPTILPYSFNTELRPTSQPQYDYYGTGQTFSKEDNIEVLASFNDKYFDGKLSVDVNAGGNIRKEKYTEVTGNTRDGLVVPDLYTLSNSKTQPFTSTNFRSRKEVRSLYARGTFGYDDFVFVDWSVRNDWSSALPRNNNSYLYPSIGTSFIFSNFTKNSLPFLTLGKVRASWAQVGSDLDPYELALLYGVGANQWNGNIVMGTPDELVDANIKPALSSAFEVGLDLRFIKNRLGFSATYYSQANKDEILSVDVTGTSGFTKKKINAGRIERNGIELQLDGTPIANANFTWDVTVNLAKNNSKIVELVEGIDAVPLRGSDDAVVQDAFQTAAVYNAVGQPWGQIRGIGMQRINGKPVLDEAGLFVPIQDQYLGSVLPDFTGGFINTFNYKNFVLSFNIDFQKGGKFFSLSDYYGTFSGLTSRTAGLNERGNPVRDPVADGGGVRVAGVDADGKEVEYFVEGKTYYQQFVNNGIAEDNLYDLSFIKLREVNLGYQLPVKKLGLQKVFTSASISLVGRNLWLIHSNVKDFDPSEISNAFGENGQFPGTRSIGFNLKLGF